jgi:hypothetical protein
VSSGAGCGSSEVCRPRGAFQHSQSRQQHVGGRQLISVVPVRQNLARVVSDGFVNSDTARLADRWRCQIALRLRMRSLVIAKLMSTGAVLRGAVLVDEHRWTSDAQLSHKRFLGHRRVPVKVSEGSVPEERFQRWCDRWWVRSSQQRVTSVFNIASE